MKMNRLLVGIICTSMAVAQLPVNVFGGTFDFDEGSEVVVVEEEQDTFENTEDNESYADDIVADPEDSLLGNPSYTLNDYNYYYDSKTKTLTVEGEGANIGYETFHNDYVNGISSKIEKIVFKSKGAWNVYQLFENLENVKEIDLSGFDTSNVDWMYGLFMGCKSLKKVNLSGLNTSKVTSMNNMFNGCESLESVDVSGFDTSNVTNMSGMFGNCKKLKTLNVSNFDTSKVEEMFGMFLECESLENLDLSGFNTSNVTNMSSMFHECKSLKTLNVSKFDTSNVTRMDDMFYSCENLTSLDVSGFNTENVTDMHLMFADCEKLQKLDLSNFNTKNVTNMMDMLRCLKSVKSLDVSHFNTAKVTNMFNMFGDCELIETMDLSNWDTSSVKNICSMFGGCKSLKTLDMSSFDLKDVNLNGFITGCYKLETFKSPYNNTEEYTLPATMVDQNGNRYVKEKTPVKTTVSLTLKASGQQDDPDDENYDHKLTLSNSSDYNSVHIYAYNGNNVIHHKDVKKGETFGFNNGNHLVITGLGPGTGMDKTPFTYFVKVAYADEEKYCDGYSHDGAICDLEYPTNDLDILVQGRHLPVGAITANGRVAGDYKITTTIASKKGNYIGIPKNGAPVKVTFAAKKTGSLNYEIANPTATIRYGAGNPEDIALSEEKNKYYYEVPVDGLARLAYSETPSVEFTVNAVVKLPAPTAKVSASTDINATLSLDVPKAAKNLPKLWYRIEGTANVPKNKTLPEGMAKFVGPLYVPARVTSLPVYLMAEEGKNLGDGAAQKYDFEVSLLQLENEPEYIDKPLTDRTAVEGALKENVIGASNEKKVSGSTKKPGYEEKLGLKKVKSTFILGETDITLATPKFSNKTYPEFRKIILAEITAPGATEPIKTSETEDDTKKITIDENNNIILENSEGLTVGVKYTLSVWPESKAGGKVGKPATLALTVKQGIDELSLSMSKTSYVKKPNKPLTIKAPTVTYNGGDKKKAPFKKIVKWELLDENGDPFEASPLYGKVTINNKGAVTVDKDLTIPEGSSYGFKIMATPNDYEGNDSDAAKTDVITLTAEEMKPNTKDAELILNTSASAANGIAVDKSDIEIEGVKTSGGKWYVTGEEIRIRIKKEGIRDDWNAGITAKPGDIHVNSVRDGEYVVVSSNEIREKLKKASYFILVFY